MQQIGRYQVVSVLGQGGMGVVYRAHDQRLDRHVAIKVIRPDVVGDETARERFRREARAAARVSHPHICPLFEFDEHEGQPYLVMELLDGEPLSARLARGPLPTPEALALAQTMLDALASLHRRGVIHRDLKPANIFLTPHGLKLLDFGLAQPVVDDEQARETGLTHAGITVGTPQYMAPEQVLDGRVDERADVFAAATVIYEMLAGRPAFEGRTLPALVHAIAYEEPAPLQGSAELERVDAVLRLALAKRAEDRLARADQFAAMLREASRAATVATQRKVTRFVALPLRLLRPDPETDFLAFSIPDAVSVALAGVASVVVRSAPPISAGDADVRAIGRELAVDVVLTGTLMRAGSEVRISAQLAETASGSVLASTVAQAPMSDLFQLQDALTTRIVSSLALPLTSRDREVLVRHAPASAEAYELYLRANELMNVPARWEEGAKLYERAVGLDPSYAPAWARLGRAQRLLAKWGGGAAAGLLSHAEASFRRAFELDPDLSIAHDLAAYVDAELGRAVDGMERLLGHAQTRPWDAGLCAGLVTTCRYAGLLDASRAAHQRVVLLDPAHPTSAGWTYFMLGDYAQARDADRGRPPYAALFAQLWTGGLSTDAIRREEDAAGHSGTRAGVAAYRAFFEGKIEEARVHLETLGRMGFNDPEGWFLYATCFARVGARDDAIRFLTRAVDGGYTPHAQLTRRSEWASLASDSRFQGLVDRTAVTVRRALDRFDAAGGPALLGRQDR